MHRITATMTTVLAMTAPLAAETHQVEVANGAFKPQSLVVAPGDTIVWSLTGSGGSIMSGSDCVPDGDFFAFGLPWGDKGPPNMSWGWNVPMVSAEIPYMHVALCGQGMTGHISVVSGGSTIQVPGDHSTTLGSSATGHLAPLASQPLAQLHDGLITGRRSPCCRR